MPGPVLYFTVKYAARNVVGTRWQSSWLYMWSVVSGAWLSSILYWLVCSQESCSNDMAVPLGICVLESLVSGPLVYFTG